MNRILYITSTLKRLGPTNQTYGLIKSLDKTNFQPYILTLSPEPEDSRYNDFFNLNVPIYSLNLSRKDMIIKGKKKLIESVRKIQPDIIHTTGIRPDTYTIKYLKQYSQVSTIRNYAFKDYPVKFGPLKGRIMAKNHIKTISKIQYLVSCSNSIAEVYKKKHKIKTRVIQNGVDNEYYSPVVLKEKQQIRKKLNLPQDKIIFIFVGSLIDRKDPITVISAFQDAQLNKKAVLLILGEGPLYDKCKKIKEDNILLKGQVSNVVDYLRAGDVFVSSSLSEGLPNAVLEAMAVQLPVILSDIDPHKEIYERNPNIGELYPLGNQKKLIEVVKQYVYENDQKRLKSGLEARKTIEKYFSARVMSESYQKLYKEIINNTL